MSDWDNLNNMHQSLLELRSRFDDIDMIIDNVLTTKDPDLIANVLIGWKQLNECRLDLIITKCEKSFKMLEQIKELEDKISTLKASLDIQQNIPK